MSTKTSNGTHLLLFIRHVSYWRRNTGQNRWSRRACEYSCGADSFFMVSWDAKIGKRYNQSIYVFFEHCGLLQVVLVQNCGLPNCLFLKLAERWILILDPPFLTCNSILSFFKKKWIISVQDDTISIFNYNKQRHAIYWLSGSLPKCPCYFEKDKKSLIRFTCRNVVCCIF